jgi:hypothetical protein
MVSLQVYADFQGLVPHAFEAQMKSETSVFSRFFGRKKDNTGADLTSPKASTVPKGKFLNM